MKLRLTLALAAAVLGCGTVRAADAGKAEPPKPRPLKQLMKDLGSDNWLVRQGATEQLGVLGKPALAKVIAALSSDNAHLRRGACDAIIAIRKTPRGMSREQANARAAEINPATEPAIKPLVKLLADDKDAWVRAGAAEALKFFGKDAREAAGKDLAKALANAIICRDEDLWVRREAMNALRPTGAEADLDPATMVKIYTEASLFTDIMFRGGPLKKLGEFGPDASPAVPVLIRFVEKFYTTGKDSRAGIYAARALGAIGATARPALPILRKLAADGPQGLVVEYKSGASLEMGKADAAEAIAKIEAAMKKPDKTDNDAHNADKPSAKKGADQ